MRDKLTPDVFFFGVSTLHTYNSVPTYIPSTPMNSRRSRYEAHQEADVEQVDVLTRDAQELATGLTVLGRLGFVRCEDRK